MVQHLFWQGLDNGASAEYCRLLRAPDMMSAIGVVIGFNPVFRIDYVLRLDPEWRVQSLHVDGIVNGKDKSFYLEKDAQHEWWRRESRVESLSGCTTIDLSVTPFTNTLAIQTAGLLPGKTAAVRVAYVDIAGGRIAAAEQEYTRINSNQYRFRAAPDFEALITVDKDALVTDYPGLFRQRM